MVPLPDLYGSLMDEDYYVLVKGMKKKVDEYEQCKWKLKDLIHQSVPNLVFINV